MPNPQTDRYAGWTPQDFQRLEQFYTPAEKDEHWLWRGYANSTPPKGRAYITPQPVFTAAREKGLPARTYSARSLVYDQVIGLQDTKKFAKLNRKCDEPLCVNPHHHELRLHNVPTKRLGPKKKGSQNKPKSPDERRNGYCSNGHDLSAANAVYASGGCRQCKREQNRRYREQHLDEINAKRAKQVQAEGSHARSWAERAEERLASY